MNADEIRRQFVEFFRQHDHVQEPSSSLIPRNDPTLLFTNAGMVQFKSLFLGEEHRARKRAVTVQKCLRAGGKHNDLENVGRTARHHTFFEMLGNFSFGDYFKDEAIAMGWRFVTGVLGLPVDRLMVTVYAEDDQAWDIWHHKMGLPADKVVRIPTHDNFWSMGETGPCGPCSEIFYDMGPEIPGGPPGSADADGDRFIEIWNLVFMQFNRDASGQMTPLPNPCIDTGAGLERITAIMQGKTNNFDTDLFVPIIEATAAIAASGGAPVPDLATDSPARVSLRVIADHIRAVSFMIADGVLPANEGRGYVLRRIMRRAIRHGRLLGIREPFLHRLLPTLEAIMGPTYPELAASRETLAMVIETEERRFADTLDSGLRLLEESIGRLGSSRTLDGATVFTLYDTFGFPMDLTEDIARERGFNIDREGFEQHMAQQRARARAAWTGSGDQKVAAVYHTLLERGVPASEFLGYGTETIQAEVAALLVEQQPVDVLETVGVRGVVMVNQTPFYGESGGQVGDAGSIRWEGGWFEVTDTQKPVHGLVAHHGLLRQGRLTPGTVVEMEVDHARRAAIRMHHSATHLLQHALRQVLGDHVKQAGSMVTAERLRLDFSHYAALTPAEITEVEDLVNAVVFANDTQETVLMTPEQATAAGAMALFGEKYGHEVRVVRIGPSLELCGGTHVSQTGEIAVFRIIGESAVAAGVRRIEAVCGPMARRSFQKEATELRRAAALVRVPPQQLVEGIEKLIGRQKELEQALEQARASTSRQLAGELVGSVRHVGAVPVVAATVSIPDVRELRDLMDRVRDQLGSAVVLLGAVQEHKVSLIAGVTPDLTAVIQAGSLIRFVSTMVGGKGGGKPDMAQGGGTQPERLPEALAAALQWIGEQQGDGIGGA